MDSLGGLVSSLRDILPPTFFILFYYILLFLDEYLIDVLMRVPLSRFSGVYPTSLGMGR